MHTGQATRAARGKFEVFGAGLLALSLSMLGGTGVHAQSQSPGPTGWYVSLAGTGSFLEKPHQTIANAPTPRSTLQVTNGVDDGWGVDVAAGRASGTFRFEGEIGRTENASKTYSATSPIQITLPQAGKNNVTRYMANGFYDLPLKGWPVQLYVGAGFGAADTHLTTFAAPARAPRAPPSQILNIKSTDFAYQLMTGVSRQVTPHLSLTLQYRWFQVGTVKGRDSRGERATRDIAGSNIDFGLRYRF